MVYTTNLKDNCPAYTHGYSFMEDGSVMYFQNNNLSGSICGRYRLISDEELTLMVLRGHIE